MFEDELHTLVKVKHILDHIVLAWESIKYNYNDLCELFYM